MTAPRTNEYGQPIGPPLPQWHARPMPPRTAMTGRWAVVERLDAARHGADLYAAFSAAPDGRDWTYMPAGPFKDRTAFDAYLARIEKSADPMHHAIVDTRTGRAVGSAALMRIDPANGVIEVGHISYSRSLRRTAVATEAMYLLMQRVFDELGYRRYEWKCDSLNAPSRAAALRYGFVFEGIFRQAIVYKSRSRDTAWFSITDAEWPRLSEAYAQWLAPGNFDAKGMQRRPLHAMIDAARQAD
ncbi:MAG: GNAT family protein [Casimicrobiaceae bacterium]